MKKTLKIILAVCLIMTSFVACSKTDIVKTYEKSENDGIVYTYYEMKDGTWKCEGTVYQYRLELNGRLNNASKDSCYVVLTDNDKLTFEDVSKSVFSSSTEDSSIMENSIIVEMK